MLWGYDVRHWLKAELLFILPLWESMVLNGLGQAKKEFFLRFACLFSAFFYVLRIDLTIWSFIKKDDAPHIFQLIQERFQ